VGRDDLDKWAAWVLRRRHGGDAEQRQKELESLLPIRDRVLDNGRVRSGDSVLDVGAGDGLIAFGALARIGATGNVILSDVSSDLLRHAQALAIEAGYEDRVSFVEARAEDLHPIPDRAVDVVTTRSVLIYVQEKARAFREFHRVLKPGGRVSIFEPINNYFPETPDEFWGFDSRPIRDLVERVSEEEEGGTDSALADDPMMNFTEKDLVQFAEQAGFSQVHAQLLIDVEPGTWVVDWERLLDTAPNPNAQTVVESLNAALTEDERARFESHIRPLADAGRGTKRSAFAYLWALKA
jgi:arsenite methyltransferase